jgi:hypothetical protein
MFSTLESDWQGRTVFLVGGGPSLRGFDFERLRGRGYVVAINDAMLALPWADAAFTIDVIWLRNRRLAFLAFAGERIAAVPEDWPAKDWPGVRLFRRENKAASSAGELICTGGNSGFAALGMALARGAARIALLGYDMTVPGHFHRGYEWHSRFGIQDYGRWARLFSVLQIASVRHGAQVINCNHRSGVRCFPFGSIEDFV